MQRAQIDASKYKNTSKTFKENTNTCKTTTKTPLNYRDTQKTEAKSTETETKQMMSYLDLWFQCRVHNLPVLPSVNVRHQHI